MILGDTQSDGRVCFMTTPLLFLLTLKYEQTACAYLIMQNLQIQITSYPVNSNVNKLVMLLKQFFFFFPFPLSWIVDTFNKFSSHHIHHFVNCLLCLCCVVIACLCFPLWLCCAFAVQAVLRAELERLYIRKCMHCAWTTSGPQYKTHNTKLPKHLAASWDQATLMLTIKTWL